MVEGSQNNQQRGAGILVAYGEAPGKGSRALRQVLDFSLYNPIDINLSFEQDSERLEFVQAIFLDNSDNSNTLTVTSNSTNQKISIPAGYQGTIPILASLSSPKFQFATTGTPLIPVQFLSFPCPAAIWPASATASTFIFGGSTGTDASANKPALLGNLLGTLAVNANRANWYAQNQSANIHQVVLDDGAGANVTIILLTGVGAGLAGGDAGNQTFKGRVRYFSAAAGDQMSLHQD